MLYDWGNDNGYPMSGCLRLRIGYQIAIESWFGNANSKTYFAVIGVSGDGGLYCIWDNKDHFRIVFLDSDGDQNRVLAEKFKDYMKLLAIGYDELGYNDLSEPPVYSGESLINPVFQDWYKKTFQSDIPKTGNNIMQKTQKYQALFSGIIISNCS